MRKLYLLMVPALLAPVFLVGCQTWGPTWSELTGQRFNVTIVNRRPTAIDRVDNQGAFPNPNLVRVEPGERRVVLQAPAPGWPGGAPLQVMMLNVEPCKRYYLNAQFENTVSTNWTPVVDFVEPVAGCQLPTKTAAK
ncbi:MAG: hypothetical protein IT518_14090 [Burkholderiales bacterium]|nr:hypothetical protein [Burkholderiales bacterium]